MDVKNNMTPCDYSKYPADWSRIRVIIIDRAGDACEWCGAVNHESHPETGSDVVLTIAHVDHDTDHNDPDNLRALCQRCHNEHDAPFRVHNRRYGRDPDQMELLQMDHDIAAMKRTITRRMVKKRLDRNENIPEEID